MRSRSLLTTILLLSAGVTILVVPGSADPPTMWRNAEQLTERELFFAASNAAPEYLEYRQAIAMIGSAFDQGAAIGKETPVFTSFGQLPFWPIDANNEFWEPATEFAEPSRRSYVTLADYPWIWLAGSNHAINCWDLHSGFSENENARYLQDAFIDSPIPAIVWEARALLRPAQSWELMNGKAPKDMRQIYRELHLAPNPRFLGGLGQSFDRVEFFYTEALPAPYLLHLSLGDQSWLWIAEVPTTSLSSGFAMQLFRDDQARAILTQQPDFKPRSLGTLSELGKQIDEPIRVAWMTESARTTDDNLRIALENRARLTLRALGSSQLAYQDQNIAKNYGSWDNMIDSDYIQRGYTRRNMIDNYSLAVFFANKDGRTQEDRSWDSHSFTIVAVPRNGLHKLRTFSICEDQTLRVATDFNLHIVGNHGNSVPTGDNPCTWEPLR